MSIQKSLSSALGAVSAVVATSKALESMEAKNEAERVKANSPDKKPKEKELFFRLLLSHPICITFPS